MLQKIGRLFTIKTRFEAWLVIYAIALGAVERGRHYLDTYPGWGGWLLALACTGVVFIAGAKLLDSVEPPAPAIAAGPYPAPLRRGVDSLVVIDPGACRRVALQSHGFHAAQIDAGPGDRPTRPTVARMSNAQSGSLNLIAPRAPADGAVPSGFQSLVPARRIDRSASAAASAVDQGEIGRARATAGEAATSSSSDEGESLHARGYTPARRRRET